MALWLAGRGWRVTALDFSRVGLDRGRARAAELDVVVDWRVADATRADLGDSGYDLVLVLYLHLSSDQLPGVLSRSAAAVAPGGQLLVLGHDRDNLLRGVGGPGDPDVLYDLETLRAAAGGLDVVRLAQVERQVGDRTAVDTLLVARRDRGVVAGAEPAPRGT